MRKPAVVQRVINSQINEIVGGGRREAIPADMQPRDRYGAPYADRDGYDDHDRTRSTTTRTTRRPSVSAAPSTRPGGGGGAATQPPTPPRAHLRSKSGTGS